MLRAHILFIFTGDPNIITLVKSDLNYCDFFISDGNCEPNKTLLSMWAAAAVNPL